MAPRGRPWPLWRGLFVSICVGWSLALSGLSAYGEDPSQATSAPMSSETALETPDQALDKALGFERLRSWREAIEVYEEALENWPTRTDLRHRLRLCETHYRLARRYQDQSFRNTLLRLSSTDAMALYSEILEKIEEFYVEPVQYEPLLRRGFDNIEVGLRDPMFLKLHATGATEERVKWLREALRSRRQQVSAQSRDDARAWVESVCESSSKALGIPSTAVILEFVFGACDALDDYSGCLTPDRLNDLYAEIDGNFVGIGVELKAGKQGLRVVSVLPGGPAEQAGILAGDEITHVGDRVLEGMELDPAASLLQGPENSSFYLSIRRVNGSTQSLSLVRRPVTVLSIESAKMFDGGIGYVRMTGFQKTTVDELSRAINGLQKQGLRHLVIDLRGNPGGLLNVAVELADAFLDRGVIVTTRGRAPGQSYRYSARSTANWTMPLSVLIDHDSASASEILAGALKENRRAEILGERSYGKGSVQSIYPLRSADAALKLTTARFYSPTDRAYSEQGVEPDIQARTVARPSDTEVTTSVSASADPDQDPVLALALRRAKQRTAAQP